MNIIHIKRDVLYTTAYGCWLCLQIGSTAYFIGQRKGYAIRLELFTPMHKWRLSWRAAFGLHRSRKVVA